VVKDLAIPSFDEHDRLHKRLAQFSREAHDAVDLAREIADIEARINDAVEELWNLKP
jgi:hypothetical protein